MTDPLYTAAAHLDKADQATGQYLNVGQPGQDATCRTCGGTVFYGVPLQGDTGGWMHIPTITEHLQPIHYDHQPAPDPDTVKGDPV